MAASENALDRRQGMMVRATDCCWIACRSIDPGIGSPKSRCALLIRRNFSSVGRRLSRGKAWQISSGGEDRGLNTVLALCDAIGLKK